MASTPASPNSTTRPDPRSIQRLGTPRDPAAPLRLAMIGNPNTGKTTLFNRLCGVRSRTANFPGSTVEAKLGTCRGDAGGIELIDLPGSYGLELELPESKLCRDCLAGEIPEFRPDAVLAVLDASNLPRNLQFLAAAARPDLPMVVALNMIDVAARRGLSIDAAKLEARIGSPVVPISARSGRGVDELLRAIDRAKAPEHPCPDRPGRSEMCAEWASRMVAESVGGAASQGTAADTFRDRLDRAFTHPVLGLVVFAAMMLGLFTTIFSLASVPMDLIDLLFASLGDAARTMLPAGPLADLVADGIVGGIAGTVIFLPQICLLFLLLSLLEDTGYLARAAFVMDRLMCKVGLPGQAFIPLLSSHACALPGIMSTRLIPDRHDRLATILVAPFMSCSARLPVYVLLTTLLFPQQPLRAGLALAGCYLLGAIAGLASAWLVRRTLLKGRSRPMVLELPPYRVPSVRTAVLTTLDRAWVFLKNAGTVILAICVVMWWLSAYPAAEPPAEADSLRSEAAVLAEAGEFAAAEANLADAETLEARAQQEGSFAGMIGRTVQPVFAPLGYDSNLTVAVLTSFLAREVFVSTMAVLTGAEDPDDGEGVVAAVKRSTRPDGSPVFTTATSASLLVFFVLAMQCLPTLAVTRRETGSWRWAGLQLVWMSTVAYAAAFVAYRAVLWSGM
ncbi:MAG: ferrous iron transporter B [Phycisphaerales bacterium]|jgi:ferrous iron transport protein B